MAHRPHFAFVAGDASAFARDYIGVVRELLAAGNRVSVAAEGELAALEAEGVEPVPIPLRAGATPGAAWRDAATAPILVARWSDEPPDVAHATGLRALPSLAAAATVARVPFTFATLDLDPAEVGGSLLPSRLPRALAGRLPTERAGRELVQRAGRRIGRFIALHRGLQDVWRDALGADRIELLDSGPGVDVEAWLSDDPRDVVQRAARDELGWADERFVWATCPSPCDATVIERLGRIGAAVARALPMVRIAVVAAHDEHGDALRARLRGSQFLHASREQRASVIRAADALLQAEAVVSFARSVMEAGAARVPAVVSAVAGHAAVVRPGANGQLVALDDTDAYIAAVRGLVDDPIAREEAGARSRSYAVRLFDRDLAASKLLGFYDALFRERVGEPLHLTLDGQLRPASSLRNE